MYRKRLKKNRAALSEHAFCLIGIPGFSQRYTTYLVFENNFLFFGEPIGKNNTTYELPLSPQIFVPNEEYSFFDNKMFGQLCFDNDPFNAIINSLP